MSMNHAPMPGGQEHENEGRLKLLITAILERTVRSYQDNLEDFEKGALPAHDKKPAIKEEDLKRPEVSLTVAEFSKLLPHAATLFEGMKGDKIFQRQSGAETPAELEKTLVDLLLSMARYKKNLLSINDSPPANQSEMVSRLTNSSSLGRDLTKGISGHMWQQEPDLSKDDLAKNAHLEASLFEEMWGGIPAAELIEIDKQMYEAGVRQFNLAGGQSSKEPVSYYRLPRMFFAPLKSGDVVEDVSKE